ncbi:MAG: hypothetical protein AAF679_11610 [Pseudomonadota bacterium]
MTLKSYLNRRREAAQARRVARLTAHLSDHVRRDVGLPVKNRFSLFF